MFIFDDRLELYSPGGLANTLTLDAMRTRQATRNEALASLLRMLGVGDIYGAGDRQYFLELRGEGVPVICEKTRELTGRDPVYELIDGAELRLMLPAASPPVDGLAGEVLVTAGGQPLVGARVVAHYPNKTWREAITDSFGRAAFGFYAELPIIVYCAAPGPRRTCRAGLASPATAFHSACGTAGRGLRHLHRGNRPSARVDRAAQIRSWTTGIGPTSIRPTSRSSREANSRCTSS